MTWRNDIDKTLKPYIENLIRESFSYKKEYKKARNEGKAQFWVALAILSRQIYNLDLKLRYLEKVIQDVAGPKLKKEVEFERKKEEKEVEKFIKELASGKYTKKKRKKKRKKKVKKRKTQKSSYKIKIAKSL